MESKIFDLGLVDFASARRFQQEIFQQVKDGILKSALIICSHYPVITLGRNYKEQNIKVNLQKLKKMNIKVVKTERGGDVTYHGPGQLIAYPIFNLVYLKKDIHWYLRALEKLIIDVLAEFGIFARRIPRLTGVWVKEDKIASIGIAIKNWVTFHGLAINVKEDDLFNFSLIRPCGMDIIMTSVESVLKKRVSIDEVKLVLTRRWQDDQGNLTRIG
ncbi:MAG: lipoyl(octanoyl) transferase LipB [Candidatus Omnitrophica bacterium]|nr:lipoyl(octanoyl) transferase LipB [Candidatus Omnitrophota bacterium]